MIKFNARACFKRLKYLVAIIVMLLPMTSQAVSAIWDNSSSCVGNDYIRMYAQNNITFYDPCECEDVSYTANSNGNDVYLIGDSLSVISQNDIKEALPNVTINAQSSIWFSQDQPSLTSGVSRIPQMSDQSILVFALGTNGGITQDDIDKLFTALEGKNVKVVLMTLYYRDMASSAQSNQESQASAQPINSNQMTSSNQLVKKIAEENENVILMDWNAAVSADPDKYLASGDSVHPQSPDGTKLFADTIKSAVDSISSIGVEANVGSGDFSIIKTAKNADVSVPYAHSNSRREDGWDAYWSDTDTTSMKNLLEKFGDLAYQLGKAIGIPYIAVLVQMRYEDPASLCGNSNYWGNYCDPSHAYPGGADDHFRATGKPVPSNLAEGFIAYGQNLTSGLYDKALGITDPKLYLETIGPMWVQGEVDGPGYGEISAMKASVDALQKYVDSAEGQAIVQNFGNYTGSLTGTQCCVDRPSSSSSSLSSSSSSTSSEVKWQDGWIVSGIDNYKKDDAHNWGVGLDTYDRGYSTTSPNGQNPGPNKITLHATESAIASNLDSAKVIYPNAADNGSDIRTLPHFTIDLKNKVLYQHGSIQTNAASLAGADNDLAGGVQIEIVGYHAKGTGDSDWYLGDDSIFTADSWNYLAQLLKAINQETGIPLESTVDWTKAEPDTHMDFQSFKDYQGILSHKHAPTPNKHKDIQDSVIWDRIKSAISGSSSDSQQRVCQTIGTADVAAFQNLIKEWAWAKTEASWETSQKKPAYASVIEKREASGDYVGLGRSGIDCGGFVTTLMQESGWDTEYNPSKGGTSTQLAYLKDSPKWDDITDSVHSNSDLQPGDVLIGTAETGHTPGHTLVYGGNISGYDYSPFFEASSSPAWAPMESYADDISYFTSRNFRVFRNNQPPIFDSVSESGLTYEQAIQFMKNYGANKNNSSYNAVGDSQWYIGCNGNNRSLGLGGSNCVTFSAFFLAKFTNHRYTSGNGVNVASSLGVPTDSNPEVWSVFSWDNGAAGHTGVVLGYHDGEWIVGHASCSNHGVGEGDGVSTYWGTNKTGDNPGSGFVKKSSDIGVATNLSGAWGLEFAHFKSEVSTSKISSYLTTGE